ncbi:MAG: DUF2157 domain-containing protein [Candidatus Hydrogenedentes bacterium]|nr:DUF2157 domain-containing protein [Candidatus Hydrogenedentota bacterium]
MNPRNIVWLYGELPRLVQAGVIPEDAAERIRYHYGPVQPVAPARLALLLCSVLGTALIGGGVLLLLAHNWEFFGRPLRVFLSFLPLVTGQALVGFTLWRKSGSAPWREGSSILLALAIGASIALIGQTYHIPGNLANFLFVWLLLGVPLIYLLGSVTATLFYFAGMLGWSLQAQNDGGHALWYWLLLAAVLPFLGNLYQQRRNAPGTLLLGWALCINLCVGFGIVLEKVLPGLWIVGYAALVTCFYLLGRSAYQDTPGQPFTVFGAVGTVILALVFTFDFGWHEIGYAYYRTNGRYVEWAGIQDYVLTVAFLAAAAALAVRAASRRDYGAMPWAVFPALATVSYVIANIEGGEDIPLLIFNLYLLVLGIIILRSGIREGRLKVANGGLAALALLFTCRFFDSDLGFVERGIAFIVLGVGFLGANLWLSRKFSRDTKEMPS